MKKRGFKANFKNFRQQFISRPQGKVGLIMLAVFLVIAVFAPIISRFHPMDDVYLAESMARPAWVRVFPANRNLPVTLHRQVDSGGFATEALLRDNDKVGEDGFQFLISPEKDVELVYKFDFTTDPPGTFNFETRYLVEALPETKTTLELFLVSPSGKNWPLWSKTVSGAIKSTGVLIDSRQLDLKRKLGLTLFQDVSSTVFNEHGEFQVLLRASTDGDAAEISLTPLGVNIQGKLHGVLGADHMGADLWSQLVYGTRISLLIGLVAAFIAVFIGTAIGIASGYIGGVVDEVFMRIADVFLSIPTTPILIILAAIMGKSVWNIVALISLFSWTSTARIVRSQTLTLKERAFVEAARASGASNSYTMLIHILPNVVPLVFASLVLLIPGAILTEATLSFLGLGDPSTATWGRMLHNARSFGAFTAQAWHWILPPGIAITLLSLTFVFIGNTLDEILNPRNKERA